MVGMDTDHYNWRQWIDRARRFHLGLVQIHSEPTEGEIGNHENVQCLETHIFGIVSCAHAFFARVSPRTCTTSVSECGIL